MVKRLPIAWVLAGCLPGFVIGGMLSGALVPQGSVRTVWAKEQSEEPQVFAHLGSHVEGGQSLFNVYCDNQRGNLIYSYLVFAGNTPSSNLVVIQDGCKKS